MFFLNGEKNFTLKKAKNQSNVLDVLSLAGVKTVWVNNNSSCKNVCTRIETLNIITSSGGEDKNTILDEKLLDTTNQILKNNKGDILIVLHTMGSHGPRYYKRFPEKFAKFKPFCNNDTPQNCSKDELNNAFDNTIVYTDYVLSRLVDILKEKKEYNDIHVLCLRPWRVIRGKWYLFTWSSKKNCTKRTNEFCNGFVAFRSDS